MKNLTEQVCNYFGVLSTQIARPAYRHLKEYTYGDLITRLLYTKVRLRDEFPEMNETTVVKMLKKLFPNKPTTCRGYDRYFLACIEYKKCNKCESIKPFNEFNKSKKETDGYNSSCRDCCKQYYETNRDTLLEQKQEYGKAHLPQRLANNAKRRAIKNMAIPSWANLEKITKIYNLCPKGYHVDHIIPLQGELVCGLHCEHNLQYLTAKENLSKGNRFDQDNYIEVYEYCEPYL